MNNRTRLLFVFAAALVAGNAALAQSSICFFDDDGARWDLSLSPRGSVTGTVQIPAPGCAPGRVLGNYAFADAVVPLHLFLPQDAAACVPRSSFSGRYWLGAGGDAEIIVFGILNDVRLLPCTGAVAPEAGPVPWWVQRP